jgi:charged multivesicular body protein 2A
MNDFERESSTMDMKEEMMSDAVDDAMEQEDEGEGEEVESDKILKEVLDEIGMNMNDAVSRRIPIQASQQCLIFKVTGHDHTLPEDPRAVLIQMQLVSAPTANPLANEPVANQRVAVAEGLVSSPAAPPSAGASGASGGPMSAEEADLQRRLDALRRD